jgi:dihydrofolate reductase
MRKVVLGIGISLDGYIARPDGSVDFLFMPRDYSMAPFFKRVDAAVMGRKSYEMGLKLGGGKAGNFGMDCYVLSRTLEPGERDGMKIVSQAPRQLLAELRKKKGKDIWLMGGGELAREFFKADLVDELYLGVVPVLLGEGIAAFAAGFPERKFSLMENKTFSQGMIALRYQRRVGSKKKSK